MTEGLAEEVQATTDQEAIEGYIEHYVEKEIPPLVLNHIKQKQRPVADKRDFPITKVG